MSLWKWGLGILGIGVGAGVVLYKVTASKAGSISPTEVIVSLKEPFIAQYSTITQFDAGGIKAAEIGKPTFVRISKVVTTAAPVPVTPGLAPIPPMVTQKKLWEGSLVLLRIDETPSVALSPSRPGGPQLMSGGSIAGIFRYDGSLPDMSNIGLKKGQLFRASGTH